MQSLGAPLSARYVRSYHITLKIVFLHRFFTQSLNNRHIGWTAAAAAAAAASPLQKTAQLHKGRSENKSCVFLERKVFAG